MKRNKRTEKLVKDVYTNKLQVTTSSLLDKRVLANSMSTLEKVKSVNSANIQRNIWVIIAKSGITQVAAVLVVFSAIGLLSLSDKGELGQRKTTGSKMAVISKTPAELVSAIVLSIAFRDGGMQAVEEQFDKAEKKVKPSLKMHLTVEQLIRELDGC